VNSELLDFADKYGMLVWSENRNLERQVIALPGPKQRRRTQPVYNAEGVKVLDDQPPFPWPFPDPMYLEEAQAMVLRDRNHPSIVIWSLCNEGE
jgi:beta-galactosidase/beta-glucuronidase